ncbi:MAG: hypothetical protein Q8P25_00305 [Candidatus Curtissbacteria bacterium]|nr:hypothetical protein [Candidatus Curtissbacteria bacterium]
MKDTKLTKAILNFFSVVLLISLIAAPIYFATGFAKVAGVKSESKYLIVSQIDKFPNLKLSQTGDTYQISFTKMGPSQAFLDILILNNPTSEAQTYMVQKNIGTADIFFGHNLDDIRKEISVPSNSSVPLSIYSTDGNEDQSVEFTINY